MRKALLALFTLALFASNAAWAQDTCTITGNVASWAAITDNVASDCSESAGDNFIINPGVSVTDTGALANLTGSVTIKSTFNAIGKLVVSADVTTSGRIIFDGRPEVCVSGANPCVIAGETAVSSLPLSSWGGSTGYSITNNANGEDATITGDETVFQMYGTTAWTSSIFHDNQIAVFMDIDGNPNNDSEASRIRPFFNVQSVSGNNLLVTTEVGDAYSSIAAVRKFKETVAACSAITSPATDQPTIADGADTDTDATAEGALEIDDNYSLRRDWLTTLSLTAGNLPGWKESLNLGVKNELVGMTIMLEANTADTYPYTIIDSQNGGASADTLRIWPPLKSLDIVSGAQSCTVGWGWGTGVTRGDEAGDVGPGAREFFTYSPAQLVTGTAANDEGTRITFQNGGGLSGSFGLLGEFENVAGWAPQILYDTNTDASTRALKWTWDVAGSGDDATLVPSTGCSGTAFILQGAGDYQFDGVQISHDAERMDCNGTGDDALPGNKVSAFHGIIYDGTNASRAVFKRLRCFALGDICVGFKDTSGEGGTVVLDDVGCGWGTTDNCFKNANRETTKLSLSKIAIVNWSPRGGQCVAGAAFNNGEWCQADADCGVGGSCYEVSDTGGIANLGFSASVNVAPATVRDVLYIAGDSDGSIFTGQKGDDALSVNGAFILDPRVNEAVGANAVYPSTYNGVWDAARVTAPIGNMWGDVTRSVTQNLWGRMTVNNTSSAIAPLRLYAERDFYALSKWRVQNNVVFDVTEVTDTTEFIRLAGDAVVEGDTIDISYNWVDHSENGGTPDFFSHAYDSLLDGPNNLRMSGNIISNFRYLLNCTGASTPDVLSSIGRTIFAPVSGLASGASMVASGCLPASAPGLTLYEQRDKAIYTTRWDTFRYGSSGRVGRERVGPALAAGYQQTPWLTSLGFESQTAGSGVWLDPMRQPALGTGRPD